MFVIDLNANSNFLDLTFCIPLIVCSVLKQEMELPPFNLICITEIQIFFFFSLHYIYFLVSGSHLTILSYVSGAVLINRRKCFNDFVCIYGHIISYIPSKLLVYSSTASNPTDRETRHYA